MESPSHRKSPKDKTCPWGTLIIVWAILGQGTKASGSSPHRVYNVTWIVTNPVTGKVVNSTSQIGVPENTFPTLYFDLCDLVGSSWDGPYGDDYGCHSSGLAHKGSLIGHSFGERHGIRSKDIYVCPGHARRKGCGGQAEGFCAEWGCETTGDAWWQPSSSWDLITLKKGAIRDLWSCNGGKQCSPCFDSTLNPDIPGATPGGRCNPLVLQFTEAGKKASWEGSRSWGLRLYRTGKDPFTLFSITRQLTRANTPQSVGPNSVISDQKAPSQPVQALPPVIPQAVTTPIPIIPVGPSATALQSYRPGTGDRLYDLVLGAYLILNVTNPNKTQDCWLCLVSSPPYYEGVAILGNYTNQTTAPHSCTAIPKHKLTLSEVSGKGLCIGSIPRTHQTLCTKEQGVYSGSYYLAAPNGTYWACNTGLTPCVSAIVLNTTADYCVLIELWPKITYHGSEEIYNHFLKKSGKSRFKREPVSMTMALLLGGITMGGIAAGVGTGTAALMETNQFRQLQAAMHTDIKALEESVSALKKSLTSLSEVVLQNRRGLDMLFLQEGGLCAALKEECCFYADHTGLVRDNMTKLTKD